MEPQADLFSQAIALHRAGRLDEAEGIYRAIVASSPAHADSLNLLGAIAHQRGNNSEAIEFLRRAIALRGDRHAYYCNLAAAYCGLHRFDEAADSARTAVTLQPNQPEPYLSIGLACQGAKRWAEAESAFREVASRWPTDSRGFASLGDCLREQGKTAQAIDAYRAALALGNDNGRIHLAVGTLLLSSEGSVPAEANLRRAVELLPQEFPALVNYGAALAGFGREREALAVYERAARLRPDDVSLLVNIGQALSALGNHAEAAEQFSCALQRDPDNPHAWCGLADCYREDERESESVLLYERSLAQEKSYEAYRGLADALTEIGEPARAEATLREALRLHPSRAEGHVRLGLLLEANGDLTGAIEAFRAALRAQPQFPPALAELGRLLKGRLPEPDKIALEAAALAPASAATRAGVHFGLAQVEDARGHFALAAEHLRQAHALAKDYQESHGRAFDPAAAGHEADRLIQTFTSARMRSGASREASERPVFVVGMPRSGTTLVEQILASHSRVFGAGELKFARRSLLRLARASTTPIDPIDAVACAAPAAVAASARWYLEQIAQRDSGAAERVVDKMPENYLLLGWIAMMFPRARIVHCRRDLRDVALSCWMTEFRAVNWSNDLHSLAARIRNYERLMRHWRDTLPVPIFEIEYERLIAEPESESRRLIAALGLDWEPACLEFHRTRRTVQTPSAADVRQPIHSRSIGRWHNYREALRPLFVELGLS